MIKSKLRTEYEARFGVVDGMLKLYDAKGNEIYRETSNGVIIDERACSDKVFIDEQTGKKFKMVEVTDA